MQFKPFGLLLGAVMLALSGNTPAWADLLPPGHKRVTHQLVFAKSPLLETHRLIAIPTRGFGGHTEVQADRPFRFSTKYGTRLYVVPAEFVPPAKVFHGEPLPFPSCDIPVHSVTSVPALSPITSIRSTCKLVGVGDQSLEVELVDHTELNDSGQPVSFRNSVLPMLILSAIGLTGCVLVWRRTRTSNPDADSKPSPSTESIG